MNLFGALDISASALRAQRIRQTIIANNIANANTTKDPVTDEPYRRKEVIFQTGVPQKGMGGGVHVASIMPDESPFKEIYNPSHPEADERGIVRMPNVNVVIEMVDMISASRSYEANVTAMDATKSMFAQAFRLLA
ncbi:MAG: flagellar basal body rod protein FlgC [Planctomycetota bacterium]|jgi:flagellar basal-body rod protein FlgC